MPLSFPPQLTGDNSRDILALQSYLYDLIVQFDNAAGSAIDPTQGEGGDGALTITEAPTGISYSPAVSTSRDGVMFGEVTITFIKPARAVGILVSYKQQAAADYQTVYAPSSPFTLQGLPVGEHYTIFLQGQAANSSLGPASPTVTVTLPFPGLSLSAGFSPAFFEADEPETPLMVPGLQGLRGQQGQAGPLGFDGEDGPRGQPGQPGIDGEDCYCSGDILVAAVIKPEIVVASGTYTPTLTNTLNLDASTAFQCQWLRVGRAVTVSGYVNVDATAAGATTLLISLPVASNIGNIYECGGVAFATAVAGQGAGILGDTANDTASMQWIAVDVANRTMAFTFTYLIS